MTTLTALLLILLVLMIIVGGKTGFKSYLSVVINACLLILVALLISWGVNIVLLQPDRKSTRLNSSHWS